MLRHPSCPILSNPICAFTSEDNMMRHPELIFVGNSLELGKEAPFFPVSQSQPSVETLTDTSFCYSVKSFWAGQVSSFLSFSVKNKQKSSFFPSWMPSLVCSPDPKNLNGFLALGSCISGCEVEEKDTKQQDTALSEEHGWWSLCCLRRKFIRKIKRGHDRLNVAERWSRYP